MLRLLLAMLLSSSLLAVAPSGPGAVSEWARHSVLTPPGPGAVDPAAYRGLKVLVYGTHKVEPGDHVWKLAKMYGTTTHSLQGSNGEELMSLALGQKVLVHNHKGILYEVQKDGETLDAIVRKFRKDAAQAEKLKREVVASRLNRLPGTALLAPYGFQPGDRVFLPGVAIEFDTFGFPFKNQSWPRISSGFGLRLHPVLRQRKAHDGWDLPKPYGTPVYAARSGRVVFAGWRSGYGRLVEIRHVDGQSTRYGHLSRVNVRTGQLAARGKTLIGAVGSSGLATGPHLHFEVRDSKGRPVNPARKIGRR